MQKTASTNIFPCKSYGFLKNIWPPFLDTFLPIKSHKMPKIQNFRNRYIGYVERLTRKATLFIKFLACMVSKLMYLFILITFARNDIF